MSSQKYPALNTGNTKHLLTLLLFALTSSAIPVSAGIPADAVPIDITGRVKIYHADNYEQGKHKYFAYLESTSEQARYNLRFKDDMPANLKSGAMVHLRGLAKDRDIYMQADGLTASVPTLVPDMATVAGEQKTLVIVSNFTDASVDCTNSAIQNTMFTDPNLKSVADLYRSTSFNNVSFTGKLAGPFTVNVSSTSACNIGAWADAADAEVKLANIDITQYPRRVYVMPANNSCGYTGVGQVGGSPSRAWIFRCGSPDSYGHELGHNLGMGHAATLSNEYGDVSDIMGAGGFGLRQINGPHMEQMGWLPAGQTQTVSQAGNFRLAPIEADPATVTAPQLLKIAKPDTGEFYYLSYRQPIGFDTGLTSGLLRGVAIHKYPGDGSARKTYLLQTLADGISFTDTINGIMITQTSHNSDGANFQVALNSTSCISSLPTLVVTPNVQSGNPGATLSYTLSVTNTDLSNCPPSSFNLAASLPLGWTGTISPASLNLSPGQTGAATWAVASPTATVSGNYGISVSANDASAANHTNTASATYSVVDACKRNPPTLELTPASQSSRAGATLTYAGVLTNKDSSGCSANTFNLSKTMPSGWSGTLSSSSLALNPGQSGSLTLSISSPITTLVGSYSASVNASDTLASVHNISGGVIYSIITDTQAPTVPTGLVGALAKQGKLLAANLRWNASNDNFGVTGYEIWRNGVKLANSANLSYQDKTISQGVSYTYWVKAYDAAGNISGASVSLTPTLQTNGGK